MINPELSEKRRQAGLKGGRRKDPTIHELLAIEASKNRKEVVGCSNNFRVLQGLCKRLQVEAGMG